MNIETPLPGVEWNLQLNVAVFLLDGSLVGHTFSIGTQDNHYSGTSAGGVNVTRCCGVVYDESERDGTCMNPECTTYAPRLERLRSSLRVV